MGVITPLAQSTPLDSFEPCLCPCCGLVAVAVLLGLYAIATARHVADDEADPLGRNRPGRPGGPLPYATPRRPPRRRLVFSPRLRWVVAGGLGLYLAGAVGWNAWDYRTRSTTVLLVDAATGRPITVRPTDVYAERDAAGFESSTTQAAPGVVRVNWNHPCLLCVQVPGYRQDGSNGTVGLDDNSPAVVTLSITR